MLPAALRHGAEFAVQNAVLRLKRRKALKAAVLRINVEREQPRIRQAHPHARIRVG